MVRFVRRNWYELALWSASFFYIFLIYYAVIRYAYVVPPGDDPFGHLTVINRIIENGFRFNGEYPFAFHFVVYLISKMVGVSFASSMVMVSPVLLLASSWAVWFCAQKFFGRAVGLVAFIIYSFMAYQPLQTFYDGTFPNILGAGTLLPIFIAYYVATFEAQSLRKQIRIGFISGGLFALIVISHHLSTIYAIALVGLTVPIFILLALRNKTPMYRVRFFTLFVLLFMSVAFVFTKTAFFISAQSLMNQFVQVSTTFPYIYFSTPAGESVVLQRTLWDYVSTLGYVPVFIGIPGLCLLVLRTVSKIAPRRNVSIMMFVWVVLLFGVSRISAIGFPSRVGRELAIPLSIMAAYLVVDVIRESRRWSWKLVGTGALGIVLCLFACLDIYSKTPRFFEENRLIRFTRDDMWILQILPAQSRVIVSGANQYFPLFRNDITFDSHYWWNNMEYEQIEFDNFDYLIAEDYKPNSWLENKINRKMFDTSPRLKLVRSYPQTFKTTFVYRVIKDPTLVGSP